MLSLIVYTAGGTDRLVTHEKSGSKRAVPLIVADLLLGFLALTLIMSELKGGMRQCWVAVKKQFDTSVSLASSLSSELRSSSLRERGGGARRTGTRQSYGGQARGGAWALRVMCLSHYIII